MDSAVDQRHSQQQGVVNARVIVDLMQRVRQLELRNQALEENNKALLEDNMELMNRLTDIAMGEPADAPDSRVEGAYDLTPPQAPASRASFPPTPPAAVPFPALDREPVELQAMRLEPWQATLSSDVLELKAPVTPKETGLQPTSAQKRAQRKLRAYESMKRAAGMLTRKQAVAAPEPSPVAPSTPPEESEPEFCPSRGSTQEKEAPVVVALDEPIELPAEPRQLWQNEIVHKTVAAYEADAASRRNARALRQQREEWDKHSRSAQDLVRRAYYRYAGNEDVSSFMRALGYDFRENDDGSDDYAFHMALQMTHPNSWTEADAEEQALADATYNKLQVWFASE